MDAKDFREQAVRTIVIPGFVPGETIKVQVQRPRILAMATRGKIPNPLMGIATNLITGKMPKGRELDIKEVAQLHELYCRACLVSPSYDEVADIITDDQMSVIMSWATGGVVELEPFRNEHEDGTGDSDGEAV